MARWEFKLPDIGEGVTEGEVVQWLVKEGEVVKEDQPMVEVMTYKATVTIAAPRAGRIAELRGKAGQVVQVHSVLVVFELATGASAPAPSGNGHAQPNATAATPAAKKDDGPAAPAVGDIRETLPGMGSPATAPRAAQSASIGAASVSTYFNEKPLATPATRKTARDLGIDLKQVRPSGPQGRVTKDDVVAHARGPSTATSTGAAPTSIAARAPIAIATGALEERVPFAGMRR